MFSSVAHVCNESSKQSVVATSPKKQYYRPLKKAKRQIPGNQDRRYTFTTPLKLSTLICSFLGVHKLSFNNLYSTKNLKEFLCVSLPSKNHVFSLMFSPNSAPWCISFASRQSSGRPRSCLRFDGKCEDSTDQYRCVYIRIHISNMVVYSQYYIRI